MIVRILIISRFVTLSAQSGVTVTLKIFILAKTGVSRDDPRPTVRVMPDYEGVALGLCVTVV